MEAVQTVEFICPHCKRPQLVVCPEKLVDQDALVEHWRNVADTFRRRALIAETLVQKLTQPLERT